MKHIVLSDAGLHQALLPITFTRPVAAIRTGILTNAERWQKLLNCEISFHTETYLGTKFPVAPESECLVVNGAVIADHQIAKAVELLQKGCLISNGIVVAAICNPDEFAQISHNRKIPITNYEGEVNAIMHVYDIFSLTGRAISIDFELMTKNRTSANLSKTNIVIGDYPVFAEEGIRAEACIFNTEQGPVYLANGSEVMEGCMIRGPFSLGEHSVLKMGAKIYGPSSIGPHSKVGGELNNVVILGLSNKAHDGFLGNSVIGEWCNLGADTNNSNLKNNYAIVKLWSYEKERFADTGLQFCGLIMGDHSKCGINTMFNTGTVVGVSANIFGDGFPRNFIPSFSWGGAAGFTEFQINKAFEVAEIVMKRREMKMSDADKEILSHIFEQTKRYRNY